MGSTRGRVGNFAIQSAYADKVIRLAKQFSILYQNDDLPKLRLRKMRAKLIRDALNYGQIERGNLRMATISSSATGTKNIEFFYRGTRIMLYNPWIARLVEIPSPFDSTPANRYQQKAIRIAVEEFEKEVSRYGS